MTTTEVLADWFNRTRNQHLTQQRRERDAYRDQMSERHARQELDRQFMLDQLRVAQPGEYDAWLRGHLLNGGEVTHFYDYPTPTMYVALHDLEVRPLYGANSFTAIIIPRGMTASGNTGHTDLYFMSGYLHQGFHDDAPGVARFAPAYTDTQMD